MMTQQRLRLACVMLVVATLLSRPSRLLAQNSSPDGEQMTGRDSPACQVVDGGPQHCLAEDIDAEGVLSLFFF